MKLNNYNNLLELFQSRYQSVDKNEIFLQSLKDKDLKFTWKQTYDCIQKLSNPSKNIFLLKIVVY